MQPDEADLYRPLVVGTTVDANGNRLSIIRRIDGSTFGIHVPKGAMRCWDDYAAITPGTITPWQVELD